MNERVQPMTEELVSHTEGKLAFSEKSIVLNLESGAIRESSFSVSGADGQKIRGRVYTSHWRMQCIAGGRFQGKQCEIAYVFDSTGMQVGDTIKGLFFVLSDFGEYRIPFAVTVQPHYLTTSEGKLKNLASFISLARLDMDAAYQAFSHPQFVNTFQGEEKKYLQRYLGLTKNGITHAAMLAFLKSTGHYKEPVQTSTLKSELKKFYAQSNVDYERRQYKQQVVGILRLYLQFRSSAISLEKWAAESKERLEPLMTTGKYKDFYYMAMVHVHLLEGETVLAKKRLDEYADSHYDIRRNPELYGYYLYLCALLRRSDAFLEQVCVHIRMLYKKHSGSGLLLWLLLMVDRELLTDNRQRYQMMEEIHNRGVHTPILYIEAAMLFRQNPMLIGELSDYEVQVLVFAKRYNLLSQEIMERIIKLALRYRDFSVTMYGLLEKCYETNPDTQCIHAICTLLIKGNKIGEEYFPWYQRGVEANLRITRLYDYYLYSMTETMDAPIPEAVLLYFQYNQDLDYRKKAYLFANLTKFQKEYPDLYENYHQDMIDFVLRQLEKGRVNHHLIYLYQRMVNRQYISQKNAYHIADFVYSYWIKEIPKDVVTVVVREPMLAEEILVSVAQQEAVVPVYTQEAIVYYQDAQGNRQVVQQDEHFERWFDKTELLESCGRYCPAHPGIMLAKCDKMITGQDDQWQMTLAQFTSETEFSLAFRMEIWQKMLDYFYQAYDNDAIEWCLDHLRIQELPAEKRSQNIELLLLLGNYEEAFAYVSTYGCEHIATKPMIRMCSRMICQREFAYDESLVDICKEIFFRGKYDEIMLSYLLDYMEGGTNELVALWQAGQQFELDTYQVAKKLIYRVLYTKYIPEKIYDIFESYYRENGKETLVLAFLTHFAEEAICRNMRIDDRIYQWIGKELLRGEEMNEICRIAWLYGISQNARLLDNVPETTVETIAGQSAETTAGQTAESTAGKAVEKAQTILQQLLLNQQYFAFYQALPVELKKNYLYVEQQYFEYKTNSGHRVYLHYQMNQEKSDAFCVEELEQSYPGIFVKTLVMFPEDVMYYYVTEQDKDGQWVACTGVLTAKEGRIDKEDKIDKEIWSNRYEKLVQVLCAAKDGQKQQDACLQEYLEESYVVKEMFSPW